MLVTIISAVSGVMSRVAAQQFPSDSAIAAILARRAEGWKGPGIVVGLVENGNQRFVAYGQRAAGGAPLDRNTVFEIGSITKPFTGVLLAEMVQRGEVRLDSPISDLLPPGVKAPERSGKPITLLDLATHTSGLPRLPANINPDNPANPANPYAAYTAELMYAALAQMELARDPGARYEYSNYGAGLLGSLLARRAGGGYEEVLTGRVLGPLGLRETVIRLPEAMKARLAPGHAGTSGTTPTSGWDFDALAGAGALRATAADLLRFVELNLEPPASPIGRALEAAAQPRRPTGTGMEIGLGWHMLPRSGRTIVWHNGGTGGYHSFAGFDRSRKMGVVVLTNTTDEIDDIGVHLLDPTFPLRVVRTEIALDSAALARFVGEYRLAPTFAIVVTLENGALWAQATNQPKFPIFAEAPAKFFYKVVDAQLVFSEGNGRITGLVLHQGGQQIPGERVK